MADQFCRKFVDDIFTKYDVDGSNILDRRELKLWLNKEMTSRPLNKRLVQRDFQTLIQEADTNGDGKLDRWEMYEYCMKTYKEDWSFDPMII